MCEYRYICPAYEQLDNRCNADCYYGSNRCIPLLLEAYHQEKGSPYEIIKKYLNFSIRGD